MFVRRPWLSCHKYEPALGMPRSACRWPFTLDPDRDTLERLRIYTTAFDPSFIGLTGSDEQLAQVRKAYGVMAEKQVVSGTAAPYLIAHSAYTYVIDRGGRLRLLFPFGLSVEEMAGDIMQLLRG